MANGTTTKSANGAQTKQAAGATKATLRAGSLPDGQGAVAVVEREEMSSRQRAVIGGTLVFVTALLLTQFIAVWPAVVAVTSVADPRPAIPRTPLLFGIGHATFDPEALLIAMVVIVGALGALVGVSRRFLYYASRDELTKRDQWSYLMRPLQGAVLAVIVYLTLRGGYLGQDQSAPVNPYGVAALSALVGLFTRHAVSKLTDVFDTLFGKPREDENIEVVERRAVGGVASAKAERSRAQRRQSIPRASH